MSEQAENQNATEEEVIPGSQPEQAGGDTQVTEPQGATEGQPAQGSTQEQPKQPVMVPVYEVQSERQKRHALEAELARYRAMEQQQQPKPQAPQGPPKFEDFDDPNEWGRANAAYHFQELSRQQEAQRAQQTKNQQYQSRVDAAGQNLQRQVSAYAAQDPSINQKIAALDVMLPQVAGLMVAESENVPGLTEALLKDQALLSSLRTMTPDQQIRAIAKVEARLGGPTGQPAKASSFPAPIPPVGAGKSTGSPKGEYTQEEVTAFLYPSS